MELTVSYELLTLATNSIVESTKHWSGRDNINDSELWVTLGAKVNGFC